MKNYRKFAGNIDPEIRKYIWFEDDKFESFPQIVQSRFLNEATEEYITELKNERKYDIAENHENGVYTNNSIYANTTNDDLHNPYKGAVDAYMRMYKMAY